MVAIRQDSLARAFEWPSVVTPTPKLESILDPTSSKDLAGRLPSNPRSKKLCIDAFNAAKAKGINPLRTPVSVDIDCSMAYKTYSVNAMGCLTATRGSTGGPWISSRGRRTTINELFRAQGVDPSMVSHKEAGISDREMGRMLGNSMSVNVCARVIASALWSAGLSSKRLG